MVRRRMVIVGVLASLAWASGCQLIAGVRTDAQVGETTTGGGGTGAGGTTTGGGGQGGGPSCSDGDKNGAETDVDCGGMTDCPRCASGDVCEADSDCEIQSCVMGTCCTPVPMDTTCMGKCDEVVNNCGQKVTCPGCMMGMETCGGGGLPNVCGSCFSPPCFVWSEAFGNDQIVQVWAMAADPAGNVYLAGDFTGGVDLGGGTLPATGIDAFVVKLDPAGKHLWSKAFANAGFQDAAVDPRGNLVLAGSVYGPADFGGGPIPDADDNDLVLVELDGDGNHVWSRAHAATTGFVGARLAIDPQGNILLGGCFSEAFYLGSTPLTSLAGTDLFVAKLDADGSEAIWTKQLGGSGDQCNDAGHVASDAMGNVFFAARFEGALDADGQLYTSSGQGDLIVGKWDPTGAKVWSDRFGDMGNQSLFGAEADSDGNLVLAGGNEGSLSFGGPAVTGPGYFVAKLDAAGGHLWSAGYAYEGACQGDTGLAVTSTDEVVLGGTICAPVTFDQTLTPVGTYDVFLARLKGGDGTPVWSRQFSGMNDALVKGLATDGKHLFMGGQFTGSIDFGLEPHTGSAGVTDMYVVKLIP